MKRDDAAELKILKDYALVKEELYRRMPGGIKIPMCGPGGSPEKIEGNTRQDLWVLRGSQSLPQTLESGLLLAKHG